MSRGAARGLSPPREPNCGDRPEAKASSEERARCASRRCHDSGLGTNVVRSAMYRLQRAHGSGGRSSECLHPTGAECDRCWRYDSELPRLECHALTQVAIAPRDTLVIEYPLITVGIPFFNAAKTLELAAASVRAQTYPNLELILMDDGSTDRSLEAAHRASASWADERGASKVRLVSDGENRGLPYRLNQITSLARGKFIARMDSDDLSHPARLERQFKALTETGCDVVSTGTIYIDGARQPMGKLHLGESPFTPDPFVMFKNGSHLVHASILAKASWCRENPYRADFNRAEDRELFLPNDQEVELPCSARAALLLLPGTEFQLREVRPLLPAGTESAAHAWAERNRVTEDGLSLRSKSREVTAPAHAPAL